MPELATQRILELRSICRLGVSKVWILLGWDLGVSVRFVRLALWLALGFGLNLGLGLGGYVFFRAVARS
jgi:hypothetical protein